MYFCFVLRGDDVIGYCRLDNKTLNGCKISITCKLRNFGYLGCSSWCFVMNSPYWLLRRSVRKKFKRVIIENVIEDDDREQDVITVHIVTDSGYQDPLDQQGVPELIDNNTNELVLD